MKARSVFIFVIARVSSPAEICQHQQGKLEYHSLAYVYNRCITKPDDRFIICSVKKRSTHDLV